MLTDYTLINRETDGKVIGYVSGLNLSKTVNAKRHLLHKPPGWAYDDVSLWQAEQAGGELVRISDKEFSLDFTTSIEVFRKRGHHFDRGYGAQICLYLKHFQVEGTHENIDKFLRWLKDEGICSDGTIAKLRQKWTGEGEQLSLFDEIPA